MPDRVEVHFSLYYLLFALSCLQKEYNIHYGRIVSMEIILDFHHDPRVITKIMIYNEYY
jgi:hypothetical protein